MDTEILITLITLLGSVAVQLGGILVNNKLISYRIEQLEEKVKKHNDHDRECWSAAIQMQAETDMKAKNMLSK